MRMYEIYEMYEGFKTGTHIYDICENSFKFYLCLRLFEAQIAISKDDVRVFCEMLIASIIARKHHLYFVDVNQSGRRFFHEAR